MSRSPAASRRRSIRSCPQNAIRSNPSERPRRCFIRSPIASAGLPACPSAIFSSSKWSKKSAEKFRAWRPSSRCRRRRTSPNGSSASAPRRGRLRSVRRIAPRSPLSTALIGGGGGAPAGVVREPLLRAAAWYYLHARGARDTPLDSVARFHLGNGARLERLNFLADTSERALQQSHGLMVNYLYDLEHIEQNH